MKATSRSANGWALGPYPDVASTFFISQDEFLQASIAAYRAAMLAQYPPVGEAWNIDGNGMGWSNAGGFAHHLIYRLGEYLGRRAILTGHLAEPCRMVMLDDFALDGRWGGPDGVRWPGADNDPIAPHPDDAVSLPGEGE
jgi:hypothetical protein